MASNLPSYRDGQQQRANMMKQPFQRPPSATGTNEGSMDEYVVPIKPQTVAPVDEDGLLTTHRALNANQITMITLGGTLGSGLLVASGSALYEGGPLGVMIAYVFVGFVCYCMMTSLCEMATYLPHKKGFVGFVSLYVHPAVGFALGWTYLSQYLIVPASHINTAAIVMEYSGYTLDLNGNPVGHNNPVPTAVWRFIFIIIVVGTNLLNISAFGRFEFWLSSFKILALIGLILFGLITDLGGARTKLGDFDRIGFRYWKPPYGPMGHANLNATGQVNTFLGWWAVMVQIWFAYMGTELLGVIVGEAINPRVSVPKATRRTYRLVISLYLLTIFIMGLVCNSNDDVFSSSNPFLSHSGQTSPFIIAANRLAAKGLVPVISAVIIIFVLSGAASTVYTGSRILYGMTLDNQAPQILRKVTARGRPIVALAVSGMLCFLGYIGQDEQNTTNQALSYFLDLTSTAGSISWICIFWAHIRFRKALKAQFYPLDTVPYLSPMYPYGTWFSLIVTIIFTIFKGHESYVDRGVPGLIVAYLIIPFFFILIVFWKLFRNEEATPLKDIDLVRGRVEAEREQDMYVMRKAQEERKVWYRRMLCSAV